MKKANTIKCPYCGARYLASEIYIPKSFVGNPDKIYKDEKGNILGFDGPDMDLKEIYTCDYCNKTFSVEATIVFKAECMNDIFAE